jgi:hypothetical protein
MWLCGTTTFRSGYEGLVWTVSPSTAIIRFITHEWGSDGDLLYKYGNDNGFSIGVGDTGGQRYRLVSLDTRIYTK